MAKKFLFQKLVQKSATIPILLALFLGSLLYSVLAVIGPSQDNLGGRAIF